MPSTVRDLVVLLPGITGSVLARRHPRDPEKTSDVWNFSASALWRMARTGGRSLRELELTDPEADDGIVASGLVEGATIVPGLWKIDGYRRVADFLVDEMGLERGRNFFEFPYDWRRDNRRSARELERKALGWLGAWRDRSGAADAKLILIGHSMGGLVSRYFLECLGGWRHTRALVTFGTPHRGSLNAVDFLVRGMRKGVGPLGVDLTDVLRSLPSVYQLLPVYECVERADGGMDRVPDAARGARLPNVDPDRAGAALAFHDEIRDAQAANADTDEYRDGGYRTYPVVGIEQPTLQSVRPEAPGDGGAVQEVTLLRSFGGRDMGGDGTVPRVSATPWELSDDRREIYAADRHASLQNGDPVLLNLKGILTREELDLRRFREAEPVTLAVDLPDAVARPEPVFVRARPSTGAPILSARVEEMDRGTVHEGRLRRARDGWQEVGFDLSPGTYRVRVAGDGSVRPVTDVFLVTEEA